MKNVPIFALACLALLASFVAHLTLGDLRIPPHAVLEALTGGPPDTQADFVVRGQRLPRALMAGFTGATMAMSGAMMQAMLRNPLASPALLGISGGATLFTIVGVLFLNLTDGSRGVAALCGAAVGGLATLVLARGIGLRPDPRGLALVLAGALVSLFCMALSQALLLSAPLHRADLLPWLTGTISQSYSARFAALWWVGALGMAAMMILARPATLVAFGAEKAATLGVSVARVRWLSLGACVLASGSAVAVCGPIGFLGLVVPHIMRPLLGFSLQALLPACAIAGATLCLLADLAARQLFAPYEPGTGALMDVLGGLAFIAIVHRVYIAPSSGGRL